MQLDKLTMLSLPSSIDKTSSVFKSLVDKKYTYQQFPIDVQIGIAIYFAVNYATREDFEGISAHVTLGENQKFVRWQANYMKRSPTLKAQTPFPDERGYKFQYYGPFLRNKDSSEGEEDVSIQQMVDAHRRAVEAAAASTDPNPTPRSSFLMNPIPLDAQGNYMLERTFWPYLPSWPLIFSFKRFVYGDAIHSDQMDSYSALVDAMGSFAIEGYDSLDPSSGETRLLVKMQSLIIDPYKTKGQVSYTDFMEFANLAMDIGYMDVEQTSMSNSYPELGRHGFWTQFYAIERLDASIYVLKNKRFAFQVYDALSWMVSSTLLTGGRDGAQTKLVDERPFLFKDMHSIPSVFFMSAASFLILRQNIIDAWRSHIYTWYYDLSKAPPWFVSLIQEPRLRLAKENLKLTAFDKIEDPPHLKALPDYELNYSDRKDWRLDVAYPLKSQRYSPDWKDGIDKTYPSLTLNTLRYDVFQKGVPTRGTIPHLVPPPGSRYDIEIFDFCRNLPRVEPIRQIGIETNANFLKNRNALGLSTHSSFDSIHGYHHKNAKDVIYKILGTGSSSPPKVIPVDDLKAIHINISKTLEAFKSEPVTHPSMGIPENVAKAKYSNPDGDIATSGFFAGDSYFGIHFMPDWEAENQCKFNSIMSLDSRISKYAQARKIILEFKTGGIAVPDKFDARTRFGCLTSFITELDTLRAKIKMNSQDLAGALDTFFNLRMPGSPIAQFDLLRNKKNLELLKLDMLERELKPPIVTNDINEELNDLVRAVSDNGWDSRPQLLAMIDSLRLALLLHCDKLEAAVELASKKIKGLETFANTSLMKKWYVGKIRNMYSDAHMVYSTHREHKDHILLNAICHVKMADKPPTEDEVNAQSDAFDVGNATLSPNNIKIFLEGKRANGRTSEKNASIAATTKHLSRKKDKKAYLSAYEEYVDSVASAEEREVQSVRKSVISELKKGSIPMRPGDPNSPLYPTFEELQCTLPIMSYNGKMGPVSIREKTTDKVLAQLDASIESLKLSIMGPTSKPTYDTLLYQIQDLENNIEAMVIHANRQLMISATEADGVAPRSFEQLNSRPPDTAVGSLHSKVKKEGEDMFVFSPMDLKTDASVESSGRGYGIAGIKKNRFTERKWQELFQIGSNTFKTKFQTAFNTVFQNNDPTEIDALKKIVPVISDYYEDILKSIQTLGLVFRFGGYYNPNSSDKWRSCDYHNPSKSQDAPINGESNTFFHGILDDDYPDLRSWYERLQGDTFEKPKWNIRRVDDVTTSPDFSYYLYESSTSIVRMFIEKASELKDLFVEPQDLTMNTSNTVTMLMESHSSLKKVPQKDPNMSLLIGLARDNRHLIGGVMNLLFQDLAEMSKKRIIPMLDEDDLEVDSFDRNDDNDENDFQNNVPLKSMRLELYQFPMQRDEFVNVWRNAILVLNYTLRTHKSYAHELEDGTIESYGTNGNIESTRWGGFEAGVALPTLKQAQELYRSYNSQMRLESLETAILKDLKTKATEIGNAWLDEIILECIVHYMSNGVNDVSVMRDLLLDENLKTNADGLKDLDSAKNSLDAKRNERIEMESKFKQPGGLASVVVHSMRLLSIDSYLYDKITKGPNKRFLEQCAEVIPQLMYAEIEKKGGIPTEEDINKFYSSSVDRCIYMLSNLHSKPTANKTVYGLVYYGSLASAFDDRMNKLILPFINKLGDNQKDSTVVLKDIVALTQAIEMESRNDGQAQFNTIVNSDRVKTLLQNVIAKIKKPKASTNAPQVNSRLEMLVYAIHRMRLEVGYNKRHTHTNKEYVQSAYSWNQQRTNAQLEINRISKLNIELNMPIQDPKSSRKRSGSSLNNIQPLVDKTPSSKQATFFDDMKNPLSVQQEQAIVLLARDIQRLVSGYQDPIFSSDDEMLAFDEALKQKLGSDSDTNLEKINKRNREKYPGIFDDDGKMRPRLLSSLQKFGYEFLDTIRRLIDASHPTQSIVTFTDSSMVDDTKADLAPYIGNQNLLLNPNELALSGLVRFTYKQEGAQRSSSIAIKIDEMYLSVRTRPIFDELYRKRVNTMTALDREFRLETDNLSKQNLLLERGMVSTSDDVLPTSLGSFYSIVESINSKKLEWKERACAFMKQMIYRVEFQWASAGVMLNYLQEFMDTNYMSSGMSDKSMSMMYMAFLELKEDLNDVWEWEKAWQEIKPSLDVLRKEDLYQRMNHGPNYDANNSSLLNTTPYFVSQGGPKPPCATYQSTKNLSLRADLLGTDLNYDTNGYVFNRMAFNYENANPESESAARTAVGSMQNVDRPWEILSVPTLQEVQQALENINSQNFSFEYFHERPVVRAVDTDLKNRYAFFIDFMCVEDALKRDPIFSSYSLDDAYRQRDEPNGNTSEHEQKLAERYGREDQVQNAATTQAYMNSKEKRSVSSIHALDEAIRWWSILRVAKPSDRLFEDSMYSDRQNVQDLTVKFNHVKLAQEDMDYRFDQLYDRIRNYMADNNIDSDDYTRELGIAYEMDSSNPMKFEMIASIAHKLNVTLYPIPQERPIRSEQTYEDLIKKGERLWLNATLETIEKTDPRNMFRTEFVKRLKFQDFDLTDLSDDEMEEAGQGEQDSAAVDASWSGFPYTDFEFVLPNTINSMNLQTAAAKRVRREKIKFGDLGFKPYLPFDEKNAAYKEELNARLDEHLQAFYTRDGRTMQIGDDIRSQARDRLDNIIELEWLARGKPWQELPSKDAYAGVYDRERDISSDVDLKETISQLEYPYWVGRFNQSGGVAYPFMASKRDVNWVVKLDTVKDGNCFYHAVAVGLVTVDAATYHAQNLTSVLRTNFREFYFRVYEKAFDLNRTNGGIALTTFPPTGQEETRRAGFWNAVKYIYNLCNGNEGQIFRDELNQSFKNTTASQSSPAFAQNYTRYMDLQRMYGADVLPPVQFFDDIWTVLKAYIHSATANKSYATDIDVAMMTHFLETPIVMYEHFSVPAPMQVVKDALNRVRTDNRRRVTLQEVADEISRSGNADASLDTVEKVNQYFNNRLFHVDPTSDDSWAFMYGHTLGWQYIDVNNPVHPILTIHEHAGERGRDHFMAISPLHMRQKAGLALHTTMEQARPQPAQHLVQVGDNSMDGMDSEGRPQDADGERGEEGEEEEEEEEEDLFEMADIMD